MRTAHLTRHIFSLSHNDARGSRLKFGVRSAHVTSSHASSSCAHVVCLILCDSPFLFLLSIFSLSSFSFTWSSASSSTMWRTNTLCTLANEDLGTLTEYDPLKECGISGKTSRFRCLGWNYGAFIQLLRGGCSLSASRTFRLTNF